MRVSGEYSAGRTHDKWRRSGGEVQGRHSTHVQTQHLVPEEAAPKYSTANFDVFLVERNRAGISLAVKANAYLVHEAKGETTVRPRLDRIPKSTFLGAEEQQSLYHWYCTSPAFHVFEKHTAGVFAKDLSATIVLV